MMDYRAIVFCDIEVRVYKAKGVFYVGMDSIIEALTLDKDLEVSYLEASNIYANINHIDTVKFENLNFWLDSIDSSQLDADTYLLLKDCRETLTEYLRHELKEELKQKQLNFVTVTNGISQRVYNGGIYYSVVDICEQAKADKEYSINQLINDDDFNGFLHYSIDGLFICEIVSDYFIGKLTGFADNTYKGVDHAAI
ncbi:MULTISPECIES: hypothetical protein [Cysteiniphilum]|uniref:Uncharacterized protein n=1 Tax=Cysteiniphilum litorale TaxID=2056700 RepID=A0A8J3E9V3_9GAMM|nr:MULTISPECIES: hypothetical protein [Cysteiniphilum]GGG03982.1 hypothetical protein GCM10010995_21840 [Cysteiniphilum litorale]